MKFNLDALVRENIKNLAPYSSARKEFGKKSDTANEIFLDANENSFGSPLNENFNRYPDPLQAEIKIVIGEWLNLSPNQIFVGNGSDEAIDLLFRVFCRPAIDEIIVTPPTYGMYEVSANINDARIKKVLLNENFELKADKVLESVSETTKLIFLCSPNNPTGNCLSAEVIEKIAGNFKGIVIVDEAYIHFSSERSFVEKIKDFPNLVVLQTFSKAWGLAGLRVGTAFASEEIISFLNKVKPPYNVSEIAQKTLLKALRNKTGVEKVVADIIKQREILRKDLNQFSFVSQIFPSDANFLLVKMIDANRIYNFLVENKIIVRNRSNVELCENCLRITVGQPNENQALIAALTLFEQNL